MSAKIKLTGKVGSGKFAIVDDEDYEHLNQFKWHLNEFGYARTGTYKFNKHNGAILMHRFILNAPKNMDVDHINHNTLDNRKINLRLCTRSQNLHNSKKRKNVYFSSKYKGVNWQEDIGRWRARIQIEKKPIHLGTFDNEIEAAIAYNNAARKYFGKFAKVNLI